MLTRQVTKMNIRCELRLVQTKKLTQLSPTGHPPNIVRLTAPAGKMLLKRREPEKERRREMMKKVAVLAAEMVSMSPPPPLPEDSGTGIVVKVAKEDSDRIELPTVDAHLVRAWYGVATNPWEENHGLDVTATAKSILAHRNTLTASNELFGDPCPKLFKVLLVAFDVSVKEVHATAVLDPEKAILFPVATASLATSECGDRRNGADDVTFEPAVPAVVVAEDQCTDVRAAAEDCDFDGILRLKSNTVVDNEIKESVQRIKNKDKEEDDKPDGSNDLAPKKLPQRDKGCPRTPQKKNKDSSDTVAIVAKAAGILALTAATSAAIAIKHADKSNRRKKRNASK